MCPVLGNVPEILPYTVPGNVKEMSKFPGVGNVHAMNKKCELSCTFHETSLPRKFRISSSVTCTLTHIVAMWHMPTQLIG